MSEETKENKCSICKKNFEPELKKNGNPFRCCKSCREKCKLKQDSYKCEHNRIRNTCKECGGNSICEHDIVRTRCRECGGGSFCEHNKRIDNCKICGNSFCEHNKQRSHCKDCKGSQICDHNRIRYQCKDCGGSQICEHNIQRSHCKNCGGSQICEHNIIRHTCKVCKGNGICEHNRIRHTCKDCKGSSFCEHNRIRYTCKDCHGNGRCEHDRIHKVCKDCKGSQICEHDRIRSQCKDCKGGSLCEHNKRRHSCVICTPKRGCQNCHSVFAPPRYRFYPYCFRCYCVLHPDVEIPRKYKLKEHHLRDALKEEFKEAELVFDKSCGPSAKRPDVLIDRGTHCVVTENDEYQHDRGDYDCEDRRVMEIFQDLGNRPLVVIRFNPDGYREKSGRRVPSCFKETKSNGFKPDPVEWKRRLDELVQTITYFTKNIPEKELTMIYLFYDEN